MTEIFSVFPYINLTNNFSFGEFDLWTDTPENWKKYLDIERPSSLLNIYVNRQGKKIHNKTIVTTEKKFDFDRLHQLTACLFFIPSKRHFIKPTSESFFNETFINNKKTSVKSSHTRIDKFVRSLVMTRGFKIYQNHNDEIIKLEPKNKFELEELEKLEKIFTSKKEGRVTKSLSFYFRTQFRSMSTYPELVDIQNFCTGFEIFFKVDAKYETGDLISKKLYKYFSLADKEEREKLRDWFIEFYKIRSLYTHGKNIPGKRLIYNNQRHIDIAKQIYCECINKYLLPRDNIARRILSSDRGVLISLFTSQQVVDNTIKLLTKGWGKHNTGDKNIEFLINCDEDYLGKLLALFYKFTLNVNKHSVSITNRKRLKSAMMTVASLLKYLVDNYRKDELREKYYIEALDEMKDLPFIAKTDNDLETLYHFTKNPMFKTNEVLGDFNNPAGLKYRDGIMFRDAFDIDMLNNVYTELYEYYCGWN